MIWAEIPSTEYEIYNLQHELRDGELVLTWQWPKGIDFVYIYKANTEAALPAEDLTEQHLKLYTREEYKARKAYTTKADTIGRYIVRIFPAIKTEGTLQLLKQENDRNTLTFTSGKAKIYYSIHYKRKLFSSRKQAQIVIRAEVPVSRDSICYVKKSGEPPASLQDGRVYTFQHDFEPGLNPQPEIPLDKHDYIRIFFTNGKQSAQHFELIPEQGEN
ncbi:hypothetical protein A8F94_09655 [Bacillus sp. FJAT-27225]|uniref:hypothetical protein n=1 Tax=Bacillus sp. FJAT-27225 TaxID=1743144 RepID=UPI00080C2ED3|nr:hypothetical protein [Bacillus sp. FJAT-27225]OCA88074.1 hypothetical protein A8F94_09655 [Bacillus sp. FJAT-27225]